MSTHEAESSSPLDTVLMLLVVLILGAAIFGFYYFETDFNVAVRVGGLFAGMGLAIAVLMQTANGKAMWTYIKGSQVEMRKVVWPTRRDSVMTTIMILIVVMILGAFLYGIDAILLWGVKILTGRG